MSKLFICEFQFLKKELSGLEFILSPVEGLQSFLKKKPARLKDISRSDGDLLGIYPEPVEGIPNATFTMKDNFIAVIVL